VLVRTAKVATVPSHGKTLPPRSFWPLEADDVPPKLLPYSDTTVTASVRDVTKG
jgi:hypothetical protein